MTTLRPSGRSTATALVAFAGALLAALAGCGGAPGTSSPAENPGTSTPVDAEATSPPGQPMAALCAAPELSATPADLAAGGELELAGRYFSTVCNEPREADEPAPPDGDATYSILWHQGDVTHDLGLVETVDHAFVTDLVVPADAEPGPATITVGETAVEVVVG